MIWKVSMIREGMTCILIMPYLSLISRYTPGTMLKFAAMGVSRVPQ